MTKGGADSLDTGKGVTFIIKPVGAACNLACDYCYFRVHCKSRATRIGDEILGRFISEYLALPQKRFDFVWHGGEPLLAGLDFFKKVIRLQKPHRRKGQKIFNGLQTNATLLNEDWVSFFKENRFHIGVSLDGPRDIHNIHRNYPSGKGSFNDVMKGISLLKGGEVSFAVLVVWAKDSLGHEKEIFEFLVETGIHKFDLLPCVLADGKEPKSSLTPAEFARSMIKMFDLWWQLDNPEVRVRLFESAIRGVLGGKQSVCKFTGACASYCTLDYNGEIYPCDNFVGMPDFVFDNIKKSNLHTVLNGEKRQRFAVQTQNLPADCVKCEWKNICNDGCVYHRYLRRGNLADKSYFCNFRKEFFDHVRKCVSKPERG
jgi:uncharacterized protein